MSAVGSLPTLLKEKKDSAIEEIDVVHANRALPSSVIVAVAARATIESENHCDTNTIRTAQERDPDIAPILEAMREERHPEPQQFADSNSTPN